MMAYTDHPRRPRHALRGIAISIALLTGVAPAAADMRHGSYTYERIEYRSQGYGHHGRRHAGPRGCGLRARAAGWCNGEPVSRRIQRIAQRKLDRHDARPRVAHPPRGTRIAPPPSARDDDDGLAIALGIAGLAAGALIAGSLATERQAEPFSPQVRRAPEPAPRVLPRYPSKEAFPDAPVAPVPYEPTQYQASVPASTGDPHEPWSAAWLEACRARYRSFNASTGTFRGYDGRDHFCTGPR